MHSVPGIGNSIRLNATYLRSFNLDIAELESAYADQHLGSGHKHLLGKQPNDADRSRLCQQQHRLNRFGTSGNGILEKIRDKSKFLIKNVLCDWHYSIHTFCPARGLPSNAITARKMPPESLTTTLSHCCWYSKESFDDDSDVPFSWEDKEFPPFVAIEGWSTSL